MTTVHRPPPSPGEVLRGIAELLVFAHNVRIVISIDHYDGSHETITMGRSPPTKEKL